MRFRITHSGKVDLLQGLLLWAGPTGPNSFVLDDDILEAASPSTLTADDISEPSLAAAEV